MMTAYIISKKGENVAIYPVGVHPETIDGLLSRVARSVSELPDGDFVVKVEKRNVRFGFIEEFENDEEVRRIIFNYLPLDLKGE